MAWKYKILPITLLLKWYYFICFFSSIVFFFWCDRGANVEVERARGLFSGICQWLSMSRCQDTKTFRRGGRGMQRYRIKDSDHSKFLSLAKTTSNDPRKMYKYQSQAYELLAIVRKWNNSYKLIVKEYV